MSSRDLPTGLIPGANLAGLDLSGRDWGIVDLDGAIITGGNLSRTLLGGSPV